MGGSQERARRRCPVQPLLPSFWRTSEPGKSCRGASEVLWRGRVGFSDGDEGQLRFPARLPRPVGSSDWKALRAAPLCSKAWSMRRMSWQTSMVSVRSQPSPLPFRGRLATRVTYTRGPKFVPVARFLGKEGREPHFSIDVLEVPTLRPRAVVIADVGVAGEILEDEPRVGRPLADAPVSDDLLVRRDGLRLVGRFHRHPASR